MMTPSRPDHDEYNHDDPENGHDHDHDNGHDEPEPTPALVRLVDLIESGSLAGPDLVLDARERFLIAAIRAFGVDRGCHLATKLWD